MHEIGIFSDRQLSTLAQICTLSLPPHLTIESLYVYEDQSSLFVWNDIKNTKWLDLLLLYTAVKNIFLSKIFSPRMRRIALALQGLTRRVINGSVACSAKCSLAGVPGTEDMSRRDCGVHFCATSPVTNHPIASAWHRKFHCE